MYSSGSGSRCIVFCERKVSADELAAHSSMSTDCHVFHGDVPQEKRELILKVLLIFLSVCVCMHPSV